MKNAGQDNDLKQPPRMAARGSCLRAFFMNGPVAVVLLFAAFPAFAGQEGGHGSAGLPQFDASTFPQQIFWLLFAFAFMYLFFARSTLPTLSRILENRREHIQSDLAAAERLGQEADQAQRVYEEKIEKARLDATAIISGAIDAGRQASEESLKHFQERADKDIETAEKRINTARQNALEGMNAAAAEAAALALEKVSGLPGDVRLARSVIDALAQKARAA